MIINRAQIQESTRGFSSQTELNELENQNIYSDCYQSNYLSQKEKLAWKMTFDSEFQNNNIQVKCKDYKNRLRSIKRVIDLEETFTKKEIVDFIQMFVLDNN
jgi:hypothetical protein